MIREAKVRLGKHRARPRYHCHGAKAYEENGDHCENHGDLVSGVPSCQLQPYEKGGRWAEGGRGILPSGLHVYIHYLDVGLLVIPLGRTLLPTHLPASVSGRVAL